MRAFSLVRTRYPHMKSTNHHSSTFFTMLVPTFFAKSISHACDFIGSNMIFAHAIDQSQFIYVVHHACTHIFRKVHSPCVRFHWFEQDFRTLNRQTTIHLRCSPCLHSHFSQST